MTLFMKKKEIYEETDHFSIDSITIVELTI